MHFRIGSSFRRPALCVLSSALLLLGLTFESSAQIRNWWIVTNDRNDMEKGRIQDLANRKKVYLNLTFSDTRPNSPANNTEQDILDSVKDAISLQKDLKIVTFPEEADFALIVRLSTGQGNGDRGPNFSLLLDADAEVSIDVIVVVPGGRLPDGSRAPRIAWEASSPNTQVEARSAARFTVDGFLWELKKVRPKR